MTEQQYTYLTTDQLAERIHFQPGTIRKNLKDSFLIEGVHYVRPFGGRKTLFIWERVEDALLNSLGEDRLSIPMANGGEIHV